jgi:hypothetical protein
MPVIVLGSRALETRGSLNGWCVLPFCSALAGRPSAPDHQLANASQKPLRLRFMTKFKSEIDTTTPN